MCIRDSPGAPPAGPKMDPEILERLVKALRCDGQVLCPILQKAQVCDKRVLLAEEFDKASVSFLISVFAIKVEQALLNLLQALLPVSCLDELEVQAASVSVLSRPCKVVRGIFQLYGPNGSIADPARADV